MIGHKITVLSRTCVAFLGTVALMVLIVDPVCAGEVLNAVKARGRLHCGVSAEIPGFSEKDPKGQWQGLNVDFCRAVAAAVLGDGDKVDFVPLKASNRFPALQARIIDLLVRNTSWTLTCEAVLKIQFPAVLFYDSQAFLVPAETDITKLAELNGATVCVEKGTTHLRNLKDYFRTHEMSVNPLMIDSASEFAAALLDGRCSACTADASQLAATGLQAQGTPLAFRILPERISKEPLSPAVWGGDQEWTTIVRWVLYALVLAEEEGVTRDNVTTNVSPKPPGDWLALSGEQGKLAEAMGVRTDWAVRAVKAVGNYGEMYERNLGRGSPLKIERGPNRLWTEGGLMYAPPVE